jgi:hypothetical protein
MEDSVSLPNYQAVFTLLWVAHLEASALRVEDEELLLELDPTEFTLRRQNWPH